jgi:hypothetical protein
MIGDKNILGSLMGTLEAELRDEANGLVNMVVALILETERKQMTWWISGYSSLIQLLVALLLYRQKRGYTLQLKKGKTWRPRQLTCQPRHDKLGGQGN